MPRKCTICFHTDLEEINRALISQGDSLRNIAIQRGVSFSSLHRHKTKHLPATMIKAAEAKKISMADDLLAQVEKLHARTLVILEKAEKADNLKMCLSAIREARGNMELLVKMQVALTLANEKNMMLIWDLPVQDPEAPSKFSTENVIDANFNEPALDHNPSTTELQPAEEPQLMILDLHVPQTSNRSEAELPDRLEHPTNREEICMIDLDPIKRMNKNPLTDRMF
jgi:hypothetical protein